MEWDILFDEQFDEWFGTLEVELQDEIWAYVELLRRRGPNLGRPRVDTVKGSAGIPFGRLWDDADLPFPT